MVNAPSVRALRGVRWPEADTVFDADPRWLGADDAYSVPLGPDRTLWLFGDTFVGDGTSRDRRAASFVRNAVAVMEGADPTRAALTFAAGPEPGEAFFAIPGPEWLWPLDGVLVGDRLLVFHMLVRPAQPGGTGGIAEWRAHGPLGFFEVIGWAATVTENPQDEPRAWRTRFAVAPTPSPIAFGAAALIDDSWLLLYGWDAAKRVYLARIPLEAATRGILEPLELWCGDGWSPDGIPAPILEDGTTEFTVHRTGDGGLAMTAVVGFAPDAALGIRTADRHEGPWSEPVRVFVPEENARPGIFAYAGKAHPQLAGPGLVATYVTIGEADVTLDDPHLYRPRFVRLSEERSDDPHD